MTARRPVDWSVILGPRAPTPVLVPTSTRGELGSLLAAFDVLLAEDHTDAIVRRAIELARSRIGLVRVGVFLVDATHRRMLGTWGTDLEGRLVDEHHVMYDLDPGGLDVFRRAETNGEHFTVLDNCPIVVQRESSTEIAGRGWVACTPIRSARSRVGIMFNDVGLSGAPIDEAQQARAAILCSLLGSVIELARSKSSAREPELRAHARHPIAAKTLSMLAGDPSLAGKEIAAALGVSLSRLVRVFKAEVGVSLVDYRNQLRLERFRALVGDGEKSLLDAARSAGFGSYAQFHRVFRAVHGAAPSDYLRAR